MQCINRSDFSFSFKNYKKKSSNLLDAKDLFDAKTNFQNRHHRRK